MQKPKRIRLYCKKCGGHGEVISRGQKLATIQRQRCHRKGRLNQGYLANVVLA